MVKVSVILLPQGFNVLLFYLSKPYFIGKKSLPAMNLLDRVVPKKSGFFDSISKMLQRNNQVNEKQQSSRNNSGVVVKGLDGLRIQLSKCCNPIPGDDIMGFVSQGQGIKVHRRDCPNIQQPEIKARLIDVYWDFASISTMKFQADLEIVGLDRPNLLNDVVTSLGQMKINILNIHADVVDMKAIIKLKISVEDASRLQQAIDNIDRIQGIYEIKRFSVHFEQQVVDAARDNVEGLVGQKLREAQIPYKKVEAVMDTSSSDSIGISKLIVTTDNPEDKIRIQKYLEEHLQIQTEVAVE